MAVLALDKEAIRMSEDDGRTTRAQERRTVPKMSLAQAERRRVARDGDDEVGRQTTGLRTELAFSLEQIDESGDLITDIVRGSSQGSSASAFASVGVLR